jgi:hypothetical protein
MSQPAVQGGACRVKGRKIRIALPNACSEIDKEKQMKTQHARDKDTHKTPPRCGLSRRCALAVVRRHGGWRLYPVGEGAAIMGAL